ncbi:hypothetical protein GS399_09980 [Pedobacter sp. HMF7647]|uniref:Helix-turn-helix domain-containing protein n=1 Tax=Hufsiella arboris TaxID=2695275 RepID=A0A7K1Y9M7_9SPHI|nr:helix-turn-helix transcriptional regulator [Hufsiella arboris]MXV51296.1 hypothetical protein [Hufsiella arboris]
MDKHYGQIVEYRVRKNGYSITDLARCMNVNRRSIYNWFNQKYLKSDIIFRIGCVIRHNFSQEFPELFIDEDFNMISNPESQSFRARYYSYNENENWKAKYISLLEKYNEMLSRESTYQAV